MLASWIQDFRHGLVLLRRDAGSSALILLVVALGIGGNTAIFTLMKAAFLDPLPFPNAERLVTISTSIEDKRIQGGTNVLSPTVSEFLEIRRHSRVLEELAFFNHREFRLTVTDEPVRVVAAQTSASFFSLLGVRPSSGRTFQPDENNPGRNGIVVVSDDFWRIRMGADLRALGTTLHLNGEPFVVVGVLPRDFRFDYPSLRVPEPADIYIPMPLESESQVGVTRGKSALPDQVRVLARIPERNGAAEAAAELDSIARALYRPEYDRPVGTGDRSFRMQPLREALVGSQRPLLWLLMSGVVLLLMIGCANTAQLLLARSLRRSREVSIRAALGATRARLIRQFLLEGIVLAAGAGAIGVLLGHVILRVLIGLLPVRNPVLESARLDPGVLAFAFALSFISALVFSIVPAIKGSMWTLSPNLNARLVVGQSNRWRHVMIGIEATLSMFLLCGAGQIAQNLWVLMSAATGFDPNQVMVMQLRLPPQPERRRRVVQEHLSKIAAIPGVDSASVASAIPLRPGNGGFIRMVGEPPEVVASRRPVWGYFVSPDYFRILGIPMVAGRTFRDDDVEGRPSVAVVNQEFVRSQGLGPEPIGQQIDDGPGGHITIVGVVSDVRVRGTQMTPEPQLYLSYLQHFLPNIYVLVRSPLAQAQLVNRVKAAIATADSEQPVFNISSMDQVFTNSIASPRFNAFLVGTFALVALAMAAGGMYSVISCLVSQRAGEIAVRIALGARRVTIVKAILLGTSAWLLGGLAAGCAFGLAASNTMRSFSNSTTSPSAGMFAVLALVFVLVMLLATVIPLRRAIRLDPVATLRCE